MHGSVMGQGEWGVWIASGVVFVGVVVALRLIMRKPSKDITEGTPFDRRLREARAAYREAAVRFAGEYSEYGDWYPKVVIPHQGGWVILKDDYGGPGERDVLEFTQLSVTPSPDPRVELEIFTRRDSNIAFTVKVKAKYPSHEAAFLTPERRQVFDDLERAIRCNMLAVSVNPLRCIIRISPLLRESAELVIFVEHALAFCKGERAPAAIDAVEIVTDAPPLCQVCGTDMIQRTVVCVRCRTLHHRECWEFARKCSTFGCGETVCTAA